MDRTANSVREPETWPDAFVTRLHAGDIDGMLALYESDARMLAPPRGELMEGHASIRSVLAGLIRTGMRMQSHVSRCVTSGDVAILYTDFIGLLSDASGQRRELRQHAIEVLRRQSDGSWKLIFGDPLARGGG